MTLEEMLESFYVDAGLTDEASRAQLIPEGDVERLLIQARLRLGPLDRRVKDITWDSGVKSIALPVDCAVVSDVEVSEGHLPRWDEWGQTLRLRDATPSSGRAEVYYSSYFDIPSRFALGEDPTTDAAGLACVSYALSRFFRKLAGSRLDYRKYSTITGQSGVDAADLRDLADDHLSEFEQARSDLELLPPSSSFYGD